jgi:hypothetical protein
VSFLYNYPFLKTEALISASVGTVFGLRIQKMKPNTSALDMGGCSSWLLARAEYREWYTDAVEKAFCHNEKTSKIAAQLKQRRPR